ncbi:aspartic peptidase domain-containing protein [Fusarium redolens]|uniref:Aspartic peptidase domain-containing protein n=1 Tax=Fusarium redolens TaxID=48865 RepID=A0A9P9GS52_FUSRE|nr:aspartic peptidase domain-containing protein [Fusarium redolens]KAH7243728.1 aspartic peptidase domain-containing protein [Fusarium redolens]
MKYNALLVAAAAAEPLTIKLESRSHSLNLSNWWNVTDFQWYGKVSVGTPPQEFNLLIDTGSTDLVIPKKGCSTCDDHASFDPQKSETYSDKPGYKFVASYDTSGDAQPYAKPLSTEGKIITDTVTIGGLSAENQTFFLGGDFPKELGKDPMGPNIDGIFGIGPPGSSVFSALNKTFTPTFWNLVKSEQLDPVFSLFLNTGNDSIGEMTLGGVDSSKYEGELTKVPFNETVVALGGSWYIDNPAYYVNKAITPSLENATSLQSVAHLDTGTAYIMAPDHQTAKDMYAAISPEIILLDKLGVWGGPCDVVKKLEPELTFTVGSGNRLVNLTMPKDAFNLGEHPSHPGQCQTVILHAPKPISDLAAVWILGSPVLKGYYTVWDGKNLELGVGQLKEEHREPVTPGTSIATTLAPCWALIAVFALI